jgi:nucleoside-diphosphate-sugar epimerase
MDFNREYATDVRIVRIFNTYGPRMALDDGRVVSNFVAQVGGAGLGGRQRWRPGGRGGRGRGRRLGGGGSPPGGARWPRPALAMGLLLPASDPGRPASQTAPRHAAPAQPAPRRAAPQALTGQPLTVYGDGLQTRSFQYISDLVAGIIAVMDGPEIGPFNIGNPGEFTMVELANLVGGGAAAGQRSGWQRRRRALHPLPVSLACGARGAGCRRAMGSPPRTLARPAGAGLGTCPTHSPCLRPPSPAAAAARR